MKLLLIYLSLSMAMMGCTSNGGINEKQPKTSFNPKYVEKLKIGYKSLALGVNDVDKIDLADLEKDHSFEMLDLEDNRVYKHEYLGKSNNLYNFRYLINGIYKGDYYHLNQKGVMVKARFITGKASKCQFVIGWCDIKTKVGNIDAKIKILTEFNDGVWVVKTYGQKLNTEREEYGKPTITHSIYDRYGLYIYHKIMYSEDSVSFEIARKI